MYKRQIVDKLFEPTELYGKDGYHTYMERNFFNTHEDYEVYREHGVNMHYDYGKELVKSEIISNLQNALDYGLRDSTNTMEHLSLIHI